MAARNTKKKGTRPDPVAGGYRIGTVSSLTGLDPNTIRAWERRHRAVEPSRSAGGTRSYSDLDVERPPGGVGVPEPRDLEQARDVGTHAGSTVFAGPERGPEGEAARDEPRVLLLVYAEAGGQGQRCDGLVAGSG